MPKALVLGAGLAGLAAAWKLSEAGWQVSVLERQDRPGGLAATLKRGDFYFDYGPHRLHSPNEQLLEWANERLNGELLLRQRKSRILMQGKFYDYPLQGKNMLKTLSPLVALKGTLDYLWTTFRQRLHPRPDRNFEDWVVNRFGRTFFDLFFGPYTEKLWGIPTSRLSADWAAQRISLLNLWDVAKRLVIRSKDTPRTYVSTFRYPRHGIGELAERLSEELKARGGELAFQHRVIQIQRDEAGNFGVTTEGPDGRRTTWEGEVLISTIPLTHFVQAAEFAPAELKAAAGRLRFRALTFLHLQLDRPVCSDDHWIYIPEPQFAFTRLSEMSNFSPETVPEGKSSLTVELACQPHDDTWNSPPEALAKLCLPQLETTGLLKATDVEDYFVVHQPEAYPLYEVGYEKPLKQLLDYFWSFDNLITCGRQGLFRYGNMDHALEMGFAAADYFLSGRNREQLNKIAAEQKWFG